MADTVYRDFDLAIDRLDAGHYRARVIASPAGQATTEFTLPFSELELENLVLRLGYSRRQVRRIDSPELEAVKVFGGRLFKVVFADEIHSCLRSSLEQVRQEGAGLRIRLRMTDAPELLDIPWEYLYNPTLNRFLSLSVGTPVVRYLELPERISPLALKPPLKMMVVISSPQDYPALDVEREWLNLKEALKDLETNGMLVVERLESPNPQVLQQRLRREKYNIFHYIGHGGFDQGTQDGVLLLEDEAGRGRPLSGQFLGAILHDEQSLRLAVLNACEGARAARSDPFAGVAQSLVQQGLSAVIAMQFQFTDEAAITFAREFYSAIADGYPVDASLAEARKAIFSRGNDVEWGTPVLYMRAPDGQIFALDQVKGPEPAQTHDSPLTRREPSLEHRLEQLYIDGLSAYWIKDWEKALKNFQTIVDLRPDYEDVASRLEGIKRQVSLMALSNQAQGFMDVGDWEAALPLLEELTEQAPDFEEASTRLALVRKKLQLAKLYRQARKLHQANQCQAALNVFAEIRELDPNYPDPEEIYLSATRELANQRRQAELSAFYNNALKMMETGQWAQARQLLNKILELEPAYRDTAGLSERVELEIAAHKNDEIPGLGSNNRPVTPDSASDIPVQGPLPLPQVEPMKTAKREPMPRQARGTKTWFAIGIFGVILLFGFAAGLARLFGGGGRGEVLSSTPPAVAVGGTAETPILPNSGAGNPTETPTPPPSATAVPVYTATSTELPSPTVPPDWKIDDYGIAMVLVPSGPFEMGRDYGADWDGPVHTVTLDDFYIDQFEVTNQKYHDCVQVGVCNPPAENSSYTRASYYDNPNYLDFPVIHVTWENARQYCEWRGARLPTEAEWEKAAGGNGGPYPWGQNHNCDLVNYNNCVGDTTKVGTYKEGVSVNNAYDMAGNVWEWVADWFSTDYYQVSPKHNPTGPDMGENRVNRGGGWNDTEDNIQVANRSAPAPGTQDEYSGFRCAADP
jgi:formylglycine-generating enzyme required for sulfatase activity/tetratricopeptide (TPR) repeat protein